MGLRGSPRFPAVFWRGVSEDFRRTIGMTDDLMGEEFGVGGFVVGGGKGNDFSRIRGQGRAVTRSFLFYTGVGRFM